MRDRFADTIDKLTAITETAPVDWAAFDAVLGETEDVNIFDGEYEETLLSEFLMNDAFFERGEIMPEAIRRFLACGYDVTANEGRNGGLALSSLCWSSYDRYVLDAARLLMKAGAPILYRTEDDEPDEEPSGVLGSIGWKLSGAWSVHSEFDFASVLEAYYVMAKYCLDGKEFDGVDSHFACLGQTLTAVSSACAPQKDGALFLYDQPLVLWFGAKPLVANCWCEFVVDPVYAEEQQQTQKDITPLFSDFIGAALQAVEYLNADTCRLRFSNGRSLLFTTRKEDGNEARGAFEIMMKQPAPALEMLCVDCICRKKGRVYSSAVTTYNELTLALFCGKEAYLLSRVNEDDRCYLTLTPCSKEFLADYTRQFPLEKPFRIHCFREQGAPVAVRMDCSSGHLYLKADDYRGIIVQLSDELFDLTAGSRLPERTGKSMEFRQRKTE